MSKSSIASALHSAATSAAPRLAPTTRAPEKGESSVQYNKLGRTDLPVSVVGFGTAPLGDLFGSVDETTACAIVGEAIDSGINFFDSSPYYGDGLAERRLGTALKGRRDQVILSTKAGRYGRSSFDFSPSRIRASLENSLRLLGTDYVDIFQLHDIEFVPLGGIIEDSYAELVRQRDAGKCRFIGATGYPIAALRRVILETDLDVVLSYAHSTLLDSCLQQSLLPVANERGIGVINAAAVALGLLTPAGPRVELPVSPELRAAARRIVAECEQLGVDVSFLANQYSIQRSGCATTVIGTAKSHHLQSAIAAAEAPIDEKVLSQVRSVVACETTHCWRSGLPENDQS
jgi:aryl-alcohol dehydrogenase-like predicted oxidoreductase